jgi:hypothetical protein
MSTPILVCRSPSDVVAAVGRVDERLLSDARRGPTQGPDDALGSGEADEVALFAGIKPLLRQIVPTGALAATRVRFEALGLSTEVTAHRASQSTTRGAVLFVARDPRIARSAAECEGRPEHDRDLGRLLGYPRCCVEAYLEVAPPRRNLEVVARAWARSPGPLCPRLNCVDLGVFHYVSWLPCSFDCRLAKAHADAVAHHLARHHGQFLARPVSRARATPAACPPGCRHERFVAATDAALSAHRLVVLEELQVSIAGAYDGGEVRVDRAWPTAWDRHPGAPVAPDALEAAARVTARIRAAGTVRVEGGTLYAGAVPILHSPDAMLMPFGGVEARGAAGRSEDHATL